MEITDLKDVLSGIRQSVDGFADRFEKLQNQVDCIDKRGQERHVSGGPEVRSLGRQVAESDQFRQFAEYGYRGTFRFHVKQAPFAERKALISNIGLGTVVVPVRLPGVTDLAQQALRIRDTMPVFTLTTGNSFDFPRQTGRTSGASPQIEGQAKGESTYNWQAVLGQIKTLAHFTHCTRQSLSDTLWLRAAIDDELLYGLLLLEESQILAGSGLGENLEGLITTATAFDTAMSQAGDTMLDRLRRAKLQARLAGLNSFPPDTFVLHPSDVAKIELLKAEEGGANKGLYILGNPATGTQMKLIWGLSVVESDSIAAGSFLVGCFRRAVKLIERQEAVVEISFEHGNNFVENKATILAEERIGLATLKPDAFIYGAF